MRTYYLSPIGGPLGLGPVPAGAYGTAMPLDPVVLLDEVSACDIAYHMVEVYLTHRRICSAIAMGSFQQIP